MKLEPLMTYRADLKPPLEVGAGPFTSPLFFFLFSPAGYSWL